MMISPWTRPIPVVSGETAPFWEATKREEFIVQQCTDCGSFQYHYRGFCCHCWSKDVQDVPIDGHGTVWTYTVVRRNRMEGFADEVPYVVALVEIPQGLKILTNIVNVDPDQVDVGMQVKLTFVDAVDELKIPMFEPVEST